MKTSTFITWAIGAAIGIYLVDTFAGWLLWLIGFTTGLLAFTAYSIRNRR